MTDAEPDDVHARECFIVSREDLKEHLGHRGIPKMQNVNFPQLVENIRQHAVIVPVMYQKSNKSTVEPEIRHFSYLGHQCLHGIWQGQRLDSFIGVQLAWQPNTGPAAAHVCGRRFSQHFTVRPDDVHDFLRVHAHRHLFFPNVRDLSRALETMGHEQGRKLRTMAARGRLHCVQVLRRHVRKFQPGTVSSIPPMAKYLAEADSPNRLVHTLRRLRANFDAFERLWAAAWKLHRRGGQEIERDAGGWPPPLGEPTAVRKILSDQIGDALQNTDREN